MQVVCNGIGNGEIRELVKGAGQLLVEARIKELWEKTDFASTVFQSLPGYAIIVADFDGNVIGYNEGARQIYGYAPAEVIGRESIETFFPERFGAAGKLQQLVGALMTEGSFAYEGEKVRKNGETFPAHIQFTLTRDNVGGVVGFVAIVQDLTERKLAEEALRMSEERYRLLVETANEAIVVAQDGLLKFFNNVLLEMTGYSRDELLAKPYAKFIHPDDRETVIQRHSRRVAGGIPPRVYDFRVVDKEGNIRWVQISTAFSTWEGRPATINCLSEVTERKRVEQELQRSEGNFRSIIDNSADGIVIVDRDGTVHLVNPAAEDIFDRRRDELLGQPFGFPLVAGETMEIDIVRRDGEEAITEMSVVDIDWKGETARLAILRDITERKRAWDELRAATATTEKASALVTMAAGVAHELNNPMMGMLNYAQYCLKHTDQDDRRYPILQRLEQETNRCIVIVKDLLSFARQEKGKPEEYKKASLAEVIERVTGLLSYRIEKENIRLTCHIAEGSPEIGMQENRIQQVVLNLISNAVDAVGEKERKEIHIEVSHDGVCVQLAVTDSGCGIAPENVGRVFDPFFSTKPAGKGTGLGLSVSRSIVIEQGGDITFESEDGVGTTFRVLLPV